uniref:Neur_chan_LBD domain-containing protein n=1 Tax=Angiostrongylus cantonensis TaxID=6313 RepID=A0A0K0D2B7_ANGCA
MLQNLTSVENLRAHEFASLEQCLYYFLASESAKRMRRLGIPHPIASVPPNYLSRQPVKIKFNQITLQHFELNEFLKDIAIHGYMEMSWMDDRLKWSRDKWKMEKLQIQSLNHVWIPLFIAQNYDTHLKNGDSFEMRRLETTSAGNVSAVLAFSLRTFCDDSDFDNYPDDVYKCCFTLEPQSNPDIIEFDASGLPIFTDPKYFRDYGWKVSGTVPQTLENPDQVAKLGFCLNLQRSSSAVRIELTVPTMVCAFLFLVTPFLGSIKIQIYAKLSVMALQFLTFILFSNRISPHLGSAATTPKLLRFLEFSVSLNGFSLGASILLWACTRVRRDLPPWRQLNQISSFVNRFLCVLQTHNSDEEETVEKASPRGNYQKVDISKVLK